MRRTDFHFYYFNLFSDYPDFSEEYLALNASIKFEEAEKIVKKQERDRELGNGAVEGSYGKYAARDDDDGDDGEPDY